MDTREDIAEKEGISVDDVDPEKVHAIVVHGGQLLDMNDDELDEVIEKHSQIVFARTSPQQKLQIVEGFQRRGYVVAVTGDGVNDSPALKRADIGIAMGITGKIKKLSTFFDTCPKFHKKGTDVSKEAAKMILLDDNFASIVNGVKEGRVIFDNLKKTIAYVSTATLPQVSPMFIAVIWRIPNPLSPLLMLAVSVGTDVKKKSFHTKTFCVNTLIVKNNFQMLPAISLSYEKAESDIMKRRPRNAATDRLVNIRLVFFSYLQVGMVQALSGIFVYFVVMGNAGFAAHALIGSAGLWFNTDKIIVFKNRYGVYVPTTNSYRMYNLFYANGAVFMSIVMNQWGTLISAKTRKLSVFQQGMKNWVLNIGLIEETCLLASIIYIPPFRALFHTEPISILYWFCPLPFAVLMVTYDELRKFCEHHSPFSFPFIPLILFLFKP